LTENRKNRILKVLSKRQSNIAIVLENIDDSHNLFASLRNCDAVGVQNVYIIDHKNRSFKAGRKSSSSAKRWLSIHYYDDVEIAFKAIRKKHDKILVTHLNKESKNIYETDLTENIAIVFGNEQFGVSEKACNLADGNIIIPQIGMIKSLNLSVSVAVILYEAFRQRKIDNADGNGIVNNEYNAILEKWIDTANNKL